MTSENTAPAADAAETAYLEDRLTTPDGVRVARYLWSAEGRETPRAVVQIVHGAAEHALRYDRFARFLAGHGFAVLASDHRGHGRTAASTGGYGMVGTEGWRATLWDLKSMTDAIRSFYPKVPIVLFGHSMGAMLAREYAEDRGKGLAGLILSGAFRSLPGADPEADLERLGERVKKEGPAAETDYVAELFGSFNKPFEHRTGYEWLSREAAEVDAYAADPACGFPFGAVLARDWVLASRRINDPRHQEGLPSKLPVHVVSGSEDPCGGPGLTYVHELLEDFRYRGTKDLSYRIHPGARHEVLNETNYQEVQEELLAWLEKRV